MHPYLEGGPWVGDVSLVLFLCAREMNIFLRAMAVIRKDCCCMPSGGVESSDSFMRFLHALRLVEMTMEGPQRGSAQRGATAAAQRAAQRGE